MLNIKDFEKVQLGSASKVFGGRPDGDPNVTSGGSESDFSPNAIYGGWTRTWSSDYNGVNGLEYCDEEIFYLNPNPAF